MEEADKLIFENLLSLGWEMDDPDGASSLNFKCLEVSDIARAMLICLNKVRKTGNLPSTLPANMAQRFRIAAAISKELKELGYRGDIGYQSVLYPNEVELRKIFMFLIERLPKLTEDYSEQPVGVGKRAIVERRAKEAIKNAIATPFVPPHCTRVARKYLCKSGSSEPSLTIHGTRHCRGFESSYYSNLEDLCSDELYRSRRDNSRDDNCRLMATLLNWHSQQLGEDDGSFGGRGKTRLDSVDSEYNKLLEPLFTNIPRDTDMYQLLLSTQAYREVRDRIKTKAVKVDTKKTEASAKEKLPSVERNEQNISSQDLGLPKNEIQVKISELSEVLEELEMNKKQKREDIERNQGEILGLTETLKEEERNYTNIERASSLLAEPELNLKRLEQSIEASKTKYAKASNQWVEYSKPLQEEIMELKLKIKSKRKKKQDLVTELSELRERMENLSVEAKKQDLIAEQLEEQVSKTTTGVNRAVYIKRILEISAKVRKVKEEIEKVLLDTRVLHKSINLLVGKLDRTFIVVENAGFQAACATEHAKPVYSACLKIHDGSDRMCQLIRETGLTRREIAHLERQVTSEKSKNIEENLDRVKNDLSRIQAENSTLKEKLKALKEKS